MLLSVGVVWRHKAPQMPRYSPRAFPPRGKSSIYYGTLEGGHQTRTGLGQSSQVNLRLLSNIQSYKDWGNLHNLIESSQKSPQGIKKPLSRVGFQGPKINKLLTLTGSSKRTQTDADKNTQSAQVLLS
jgi:hypothetical protein